MKAQAAYDGIDWKRKKKKTKTEIRAKVEEGSVSNE
jgi:hypothetical protein